MDKIFNLYFSVLCFVFVFGIKKTGTLFSLSPVYLLEIILRSTMAVTEPFYNAQN